MRAPIVLTLLVAGIVAAGLGLAGCRGGVRDEARLRAVAAERAATAPAVAATPPASPPAPPTAPAAPVVYRAEYYQISDG